MATTKHARGQFEVKEGITDPFIVATSPLRSPDFLSFGLRPGLSLHEAEEIADYLNKNLEQVAITCFGDAEDTAGELNVSEQIRERILGVHRLGADRPEQVIGRYVPYGQPFSLALTELKKALAAGDAPAAKAAVETVESFVAHVLNDWARQLELSREILDRFGKGKEGEAA